MRAIWSVLLLLALILTSAAQDPAKKPDADPKPDPKKAPEAKEAPAWVLPEKERKKVQGHLRDYLTGKKNRRDVLAKFQKYLDKLIDGHSALEDVAGIVKIVNWLRPNAGNKIGRKGKVTLKKVNLEVHKFPGGVGTVKYHLYLPTSYDPRKKLSPVIFCMPSNRKWPDGKKYIEQCWINRSEDVKKNYIVVVPKPQAKGDSWGSAKSRARAMISLRHVIGTFDADKKTGGPASDKLRVFIDGEDSAAIVAGRFPEMFAGAILRNADGRSLGRTNLRVAGGLSKLPAYCIYDGKKKVQKQFAEKLRAANGQSLLIEAKDDKFLGDATALYTWMEARPAYSHPRSIEYTIHEPSFQRHYWINVLQYDASVKPAASFIAEADRAKNVVRIEVNGVTRFELFLNDAIVDLNKKLKIVVVEGQKEFEFKNEKVTRDLGKMLEELVGSNSPERVYPSRFEIDLPTLRAKQAQIDAEKAKEDAKKDGAKKGDASIDKGGKGKAKAKPKVDGD